MSSDPRDEKTPGDGARSDNAFAGLIEQTHRRLEHLYEISKLFASFANVEETFAPVLGVVTRTLPLRSAILIESEDGRSKTSVWPAESQGSERMRAAKEHASEAYAYFIGDPSPESRARLAQTSEAAPSGR